MQRLFESKSLNRNIEENNCHEINLNTSSDKFMAVGCLKQLFNGGKTYPARHGVQQC